MALLGAVIGVVLSGVVAIRVERNRERRAVSAAARLVHAELVAIASQLKAAIDLESPLPFVEEFVTRAWPELRPVLATTEDAHIWEATSEAYAHVEVLRLNYTSLDGAQARGSLTDEGVAQVRDVMTSVQAGLAALAKRSGLRDARYAELMDRVIAVRVRNLPED